MSKLIKITPEYLEGVRADFERIISNGKLTDGRLDFTKVFNVENRRATVCFTSMAWAKMTALIREFNHEVAWHGVAHRVEDESKDEYIISDIVVYPQEVSGASVEMDEEKYAQWLMDNADDERFDNLRMQGHSHVRMGTTPSSVDLEHQEEILNMLGDDGFYIFMIWNKSLAHNTRIYDMKKNILFENADISIVRDDNEIDRFLKTARDIVQTKNYTTICSSAPGESFIIGGAVPDNNQTASGEYSHVVESYNGNDYGYWPCSHA